MYSKTISYFPKLYKIVDNYDILYILPSKYVRMYRYPSGPVSMSVILPSKPFAMVNLFDSS
jgi:hypothetical protein